MSLKFTFEILNLCSCGSDLCLVQLRFLANDYIASQALNQTMVLPLQNWFVTIVLSIFIYQTSLTTPAFEETDSLFAQQKTVYNGVFWSGEFWCSARLAHNSWGISEIGKASTPLCGFCSTIKREYVDLLSTKWTEPDWIYCGFFRLFVIRRNYLVSSVARHYKENLQVS